MTQTKIEFTAKPNSPDDWDAWKNQIRHMQALLTPQKFKNTMVDEWAQDVRLSLRKCKRSGTQRYAIEEQTMAEVVDVIETSFPVFAQIIEADIQKGCVTTVNEILDRLVMSVPNQPIAKVAAATNFRLDHQKPASPAQSPAGPSRPRRERRSCNFCGRKHQIKDAANHWESCFMVLPHTCPPSLSSLLLSEAARERTRKAIAAAPKATQDAIAAAKRGKEAPPPTLVAAALPSQSTENDTVMLSSGAEAHIFNDRSWFRTLNPGEWELLGLFDKPVKANGSGEVLLELENGNQLLLKNAIFCPDSARNMISEDTLKKKGIFWNTEQDVVYTRRKNRVVEVFRIIRVNRQPLVPVKRVSPSRES
ncbi:hypothetical protein G3M48_000525 [Beauveria asiatica]|uniref:Retrovirus-related Pol polyprotein from transposon TNT 1-94-like beta-barrel domain-containing protein n=1 Tax=Beauveria asiatica TaxID=1069075 RepID=A0AAW0RGT2_9HYPO